MDTSTAPADTVENGEIRNRSGHFHMKTKSWLYFRRDLFNSTMRTPRILRYIFSDASVPDVISVIKPLYELTHE